MGLYFGLSTFFSDPLPFSSFTLPICLLINTLSSVTPQNILDSLMLAENANLF